MAALAVAGELLLLLRLRWQRGAGVALHLAPCRLDHAADAPVAPPDKVLHG